MEQLSKLTEKDIKDYEKAGNIASDVVKYAKTIIKPDTLLVDLAEKIEAKILELGGEIAFPVNLCINDTAAHYSPSLNDDTKAKGLLKVDIGVHVNGCIADTAFSLDLTKDKKYTELINSSKEALNQVLEVIKKDVELRQIGSIIHSIITSKGFSPIRNLSGHELGKYIVHAGITIPNYDNGNDNKITYGVYAIEPFATYGRGIVKEGGKSNIYRLEKEAGVRDPIARKIYNYIVEKYKTLPFSQRAIEKQFGSRARIALLFLEKAGILHHYPQLVEKAGQPVSQAEHTLIIDNEKTKVTTK
jgi:methionyl aminopeptidase